MKEEDALEFYYTQLCQFRISVTVLFHWPFGTTIQDLRSLYSTYSFTRYFKSIQCSLS